MGLGLEGEGSWGRMAVLELSLSSTVVEGLLTTPIWLRI